jgi:hypothetical protein
MKLATSSAPAQRSSNVGRPRGFGMKMSMKAAEILSGGLYSDAIRAIIRELGTNAADAHVAAGKRHVPFVVIIPSLTDPNLTIQDFGTGLSDYRIRGYFECLCGHTEDSDAEPAPVPNRQDIYTCPKCGEPGMTFRQGNYTVYFDSDKNHSNDYTGCLGLGSKSPFAYTDSYTVTSVCDGMKGIYTMFKGEEMPGVVRLSYEPTDEPSGLKVTVPVQAKDFNLFRTKAIEVYKWFETKPLVTGVSADQLKIPAIAKESGDWMIFAHDQGQRHHYRGQHVDSFGVLMGNVHYPVGRWQDLDEEFRNSLTKAETFLAQEVGPVLRVGIGEVNMAASREALKYDSGPTYATLKERLRKLAADLIAETERDLSAVETMWDARVQLWRFTSRYYLRGLIDSSGLRWRGKEVSTGIHFGDGDKRVAYGTRYEWVAGRRTNDPMRIARDRVEYISAKEDVLVFRKDVDTGFHTRIRLLMEQARRNRTHLTVYLIEPATEDDGAFVKWMRDEEFDHLVKPVSSLPEPPRAERESRKTAKIVRLQHSFDSPVYAWRDADVDLDDTEEEVVYVEVKGFEWRAGKVSDPETEDRYSWSTGGFAPPASLKSRLERMDDYTGLMYWRDVVGVRSAMLPKIEKLKNWKRLDVWLKEKLEADAAARDAAMRRRLDRSLDCLETNLVQRVQGYLEAIPSLRAKSPARLLYEAQDEVHGKYNNVTAGACDYACSLLGVPLPDLSRVEKRITNAIAAFNRAYPMIKHFVGSSHIQEEPLKAIFEYIQLIDKQRPRQPAEAITTSEA